MAAAGLQCCAYLSVFLFIWYMFSLIFLMNPDLIHDKKTRLQMPPRDYIEGSHYLVSHRGGSIEALENTMNAFKHSVELGVHVIECDVRITKDGEIMVAHDQDFDRVFKNTTFSKKMNKIRLTNADDLPEFKDKIDVLFTWPT